MLWAKVAVQPYELRVRGLLWGRRVPRQAVVQVTDYPAVRWRTRRGTVRWTPLHGWASPWVLGEVVDELGWPTAGPDPRTKRSRVWQLRQWAGC